MKRVTLVLLFLVAVAAPLFGSSSIYPRKLDDSQAVYLTPDRFPVHADGKADDSAAIQQAIDRVQETTGQGILFIPSGRYRLTRTLFVWPGVRLIGYGPTRPVFVLADNTPGFQTGPAYMVFFAGFRPGTLSPQFKKLMMGRFPNGHPPSTPGTVPPTFVPDANPGTFYSALSNIDFEVGEGDSGAVCVRFHSAQHTFLTHMDFHLGSALAALYDVGNESEDLHFYGGQYGIITGRPSPGWQFTLIDSSFDGQQNAAIKEHEAGLTLIHDAFSNVPKVIDIEAGHSDELWAKGLRLQNIRGPAITISQENNANTEINLEGVVCNRVPVFVRFRQSGRQELSKGEIYEVRLFSHGLTMPHLGAQSTIATNYVASDLTAMPSPLLPAIRSLPPEDSWVNLKSLGAKGDGKTDDTAVIQKAVDENRVVYIPSGDYIVSNTITLRPDTVLIGLHPSATQFDILDSTPAFQGPGSPKPLLEAPQGGNNLVTGIGLYGGGINDRVVGALWMAGKDSLMDDVRFLGGHGTYFPDHNLVNPYNNDHSADPDIQRRWDAQYPSLWITNGGGGTFADIWTPDTFAQAGLYISDTTTPGHVYQLSSEHHVRNEVKLDRVSNWELFAVQTEEERGESGFALPLEIDRSHNVTIANYFGYRVISSYQPFPYAVRVSDSSDIRFRNVHVYSNSKVPFDNSVFDQTYRVQVRPLEFASLDITGSAPEHSQPSVVPVIVGGAEPTKLATGFFNISGAAVDGVGNLYFVDAHWQRIYQWSAERREAAIVRDTPLEPVNLAFDKAGDMIVTSYARKGVVYWFRPGTPEYDVHFLKPEQATSRPGMTAFVASDYWTLDAETINSIAEEKKYQYVSPDHTIFIPAGENFVSGELAWGTKTGDVITSYGLERAVPGQTVYVTSAYQQKTYRAMVDPDGTLSNLKLFAEQGGTSVAQDGNGNIYIADGQVLVYNKSGKQIGTIDVPERPIDLVLGGNNGATLFILTHHSLFSIDVYNKD
ncbi:MAG TPA: glycosyl hydrolase family 28-related protein [Candidatus Acidoferrum sp.]|nr:glycosyl hydrolase family 28-related protein [Candidatus Acidoferrum sp.]